MLAARPNSMISSYYDIIGDSINWKHHVPAMLKTLKTLCSYLITKIIVLWIWHGNSDQRSILFGAIKMHIT